MKPSLSRKVIVTKHARQRIYERFGQISDRELTDLVRNARLNGKNSKNMSEPYYKYGIQHNIFKDETNGRKVRLFKNMYFVFESSYGIPSGILTTVILYDPKEVT